MATKNWKVISVERRGHLAIIRSTDENNVEHTTTEPAFLFEWDDAKAAAKWNEHEARQLIEAVKETKESEILNAKHYALISTINFIVDKLFVDAAVLRSVRRKSIEQVVKHCKERLRQLEIGSQVLDAAEARRYDTEGKRGDEPE